MKRQILVVFSVILALSSIAVSGQQAIAQGTDETPIVSHEESTSDGEVSTAASAIVWRCYGRTDHPHPSTHFPGFVNVKSSIHSCTTSASLYTSVTLYRNGVKVDYENAYRDGLWVNAYGNVPCTGNTDYYFARSFHQVVVGNSGGIGTTDNSANVPPC